MKIDKKQEDKNEKIVEPFLMEFLKQKNCTGKEERDPIT